MSWEAGCSTLRSVFFDPLKTEEASCQDSEVSIHLTLWLHTSYRIPLNLYLGVKVHKHLNIKYFTPFAFIFAKQI